MNVTKPSHIYPNKRRMGYLRVSPHVGRDSPTTASRLTHEWLRPFNKHFFRSNIFHPAPWITSGWRMLITIFMVGGGKKLRGFPNGLNVPK